MSFTPNIPPSVSSRETKEMVSGGDLNEENGEERTKKREDYKKLKELEEARKAGTAPAMKDEEGKDINPHIPQYIMQAPWYFGARTATLKHQRQQDEKIKTYAGLDQWYKKGVKEGPVATKYRKGACENCGALTHKRKDCLERPRRLGAKFTGTDIAPDEYHNFVIDHDFEGKRDRWNGYNIDVHQKKIMEDFQKLEDAKKVLKGKNLEESEIVETEKTKEEEGDDEDRDDDEDKYAEDMDMPGHKFETKQRITVRNLRIREDTAKYLYNLDVNSAYYDPKTRSMRENPFQEKDPTKIPFAGDNFVRMSGDAMGIANRQMFAWEAYEKGAEVHLQADPTKLETLAKEFKKRKEDFKSKTKNSILDKYGGEEHLDAPPKQLLLAQTEDYVEYSRHGTIIKGQEKAKIKSRYEEDVYLNNHKSIWGSYWNAGQWGYKCCHSTIKESYCTGSSGIEAAKSSLLLPEEVTENTPVPDSPNKESESIDPEKQKLLKLIQNQELKIEEEKRKRKEKKDKKKKRRKRERNHKKKKGKQSSDSEESSTESEDEKASRLKRIKEAVEKEKKRIAEVDKVLALDERKRKYNCMYEAAAPTEEEMEAFQRTKKNFDDPMANFIT